METEQKNSLERFHNKNYKLLLLIPIALLIFSLISIGVFYTQNGDFINKDISLTGGTSATIYDKINPEELEQALSPDLEDLSIREIYDLVTKEQKSINY